ncbi:MAG: TIGR03905 family TSCPD domain-containing protein [Clostridium cadaveris]|nr:TIGR03905 family TSCPD domain-containing protein [Clostridium cadaveris]MDY4950489.1 TIGR03905 family TSCPD domain-containing protein [Clostridium cadaveris]
MITFKTQGVCARNINFEVVDNKVTSVSFEGGCNGNLQGISKLVEGMEINEVIDRLKGIKCGSKKTSCPDQLAIALESL